MSWRPRALAPGALGSAGLDRTVELDIPALPAFALTVARIASTRGANARCPVMDAPPAARPEANSPPPRSALRLLP